MIGCSSSEDEGSSGDSRPWIQAPKVTGSVGGVSGSSVSGQSAALSLMDPSACSGCDSTAELIFSMGANYVSIGNGADMSTCLLQAFVSDGVIPGDGSERIIVMDGGTSKMKVSATVSGGVLTSYRLHSCDDSSSTTANDSYISSTTAADGSTTIEFKHDNRLSGASRFQAALAINGTFSGGVWTDKSVTMDYKNSMGNARFQMTQASSSMVVKGTLNFGSQHFLYGKFKLLGDRASTYAMDEGSAKQTTTYNGAETTVHWNANGQSTGGTPSMYASDVSAATYLNVPTFSGDITGSEEWNCQAGSTPVITEITMSAETYSRLQACMQ